MKTLNITRTYPNLLLLISMGLAPQCQQKASNITNYHLHRISNILSVQRNLTNSVAIPIDEATEK